MLGYWAAPSSLPAFPRFLPLAAAGSGLNPDSLGSLFPLGTAMDPLPIPGLLELGGFGIPEGMAVIQQRNENQEYAPSLPSYIKKLPKIQVKTVDYSQTWSCTAFLGKP